MRGLRIKYFIFSILAMLSIVSIGFASWITIVDNTSTIIDGNIYVDDIMYSNDYISCENVEMFSFFRYGFVKDNQFINHGDIIVPITIKNINNTQTINTTIFLEYYNLKIFKDNSWITISAIVEDQNGNQLENVEISTLQTKIILDFTTSQLSEDQSTYNYTITYSFSYADNIGNQEMFRRYIYPTLVSDLYNEKLKFKFSALIKGN